MKSGLAEKNPLGASGIVSQKVAYRVPDIWKGLHGVYSTLSADTILSADTGKC